MTAWEITRKDLRLLIRDRRALAVLVILPLVFISILGMSMGKLSGLKNSNHQLNVGIVTVADSVAARSAVSRLSGLPFLNVTRLLNNSGEQDQSGESELSAVITFGDQFQERVEKLTPKDILNGKSGRLADGLGSIDVRLDTVSAGGTESVLIEYVVMNEVVRSIAPDVLRRVGLLQGSMDDDDTSTSQDVVNEFVESTAGNKTTSAAIYGALVPSYTVMFVFFLVNIMGRSFIAERELGTLRRLRMAPARPVSILLGKTLPFLVISLAQTAVLFLCGRLLFGMAWGEHPWLLIPIIFCTSLAATALGLCFATLVRTDSQLSAYGNLIVLTMAGISGCFMPRDWLPETMQTISLATPHAWSLMAYHNALGDSVSGGYVMQCCGVLVLFAVVFFAIGWTRFGHID
jgi:ABC-2 type transport system permease protein